MPVRSFGDQGALFTELSLEGLYLSFFLRAVRNFDESAHNLEIATNLPVIYSMLINNAEQPSA